MAIKDVNRGLNLTQQVAEILGSAIVNGDYGEHNQVPSEAVLCKQLDVSRSATREAVKSLAAKGLLLSRTRQGIRILPQSKWNLFDADVLRWVRDTTPTLDLLREFNQLRISIEPEAARLAALHQDEVKIEKIAQTLEQMKIAEGDQDGFLESDIAFHKAILAASGNRFYAHLGRIIDTTLRMSIQFTNQQTNTPAAAYAAHKEIYDAIVRGDPEESFDTSKLIISIALQTINEADYHSAIDPSS